MTTEDLVREGDLIVLGRVTATEPDGIYVGPQKELFTRHTLKVEAYYKGEASEEIPLLTRGGVETKVVGGQIRRTFTTGATIVEGARDGEVLLVFLKAMPQGYGFVQWDSARRPVYLSEFIKGEPEPTVNLSFRKKRYMRGFALQGFENLERLEGGPDSSAKVEAKLKSTKGIEESIPIRELRGRIAEVIEAEMGSGG
jgi:hypothetical protein